MPTYDVAVDPEAENNSHALMVRLVGRSKRVLDVGCATGYLGEVLRSHGCRVSGVELDPEAALRAKEVLEDVLVADLDSVVLSNHFEPGTFDVIVFGDVLEHLKDPGRLLRDSVPLLSDKGYVVVSIPNVSHGSVRLALAQGRWRYTDRGLLDVTHIRFFTRATFLELMSSSGLAVTELIPTTVDALETEVKVDVATLPDGLLDWVRKQPDADTYQFVARAIRDDADGSLMKLRHTVNESLEQARALADHLAAKSAEVERLEAAVRALEATKVRLAADSDELAALERTALMRATKFPRGLYSDLRRRLNTSSSVHRD